MFNPFRPEFTIVIFIHYKPRIAVAILGLQWMKMIGCGLKIIENCHVLVNQFHGNFHSKALGCRKKRSVFKIIENCHVLVNQFHGNFHPKTLGCRKIGLFSGMSNDALMHREDLKG